MRRIDINVDIGEGAGHDRDLLEFATSANVCCGVHAGDAETTCETIVLCHAMGVRVGAHPGYADRAHFGRRTLSELDEGQREGLYHQLVDQVRLVEQDAVYIKPHGGLYNDSCGFGDASTAVASLCMRFHLPLMGLPGTFHESIGEATGFGVIREGFADRRYGSDGRLVPRSEAGSLITDLSEVADQVLARAGLVDSICVHGDGVRAVETVAVVRETLDSAGYEVGWQ